MRSPELLILRHGETEWNAQGRMQGHLDSPLTVLGQAQARHQHSLLRAHGLNGFRALSSPQGRAVQTAAIALAGLVPDIHTDLRLREIGMGAWQGLTRSQILARVGEGEWIDAPFALYTKAPQGEGFAPLAARCADFLASLTGPTVIVTHGITSRMIRLLALGLDPADLAALEQLPGGQGVVYHLKDGLQTLLA